MDPKLKALIEILMDCGNLPEETQEKIANLREPDHTEPAV